MKNYSEIINKILKDETEGQHVLPKRGEILSILKFSLMEINEKSFNEEIQILVDLNESPENMMVSFHKSLRQRDVSDSANIDMILYNLFHLDIPNKKMVEIFKYITYFKDLNEKEIIEKYQWSELGFGE